MQLPRPRHFHSFPLCKTIYECTGRQHFISSRACPKGMQYFSLLHHIFRRSRSMRGRSRCHCGVERWALKKLDRHVQDFGVSCSHEKDFSMTITHSQFYSKVLCFDSGFKHITPESDYMTLHDEGLSLKDPLIQYQLQNKNNKAELECWLIITRNKTYHSVSVFCPSAPLNCHLGSAGLGIFLHKSPPHTGAIFSH